MPHTLFTDRESAEGTGLHGAKVGTGAGERRAHLRAGRSREAEPVEELTLVLQPVGGPDADPTVGAGGQPELTSFHPKLVVLQKIKATLRLLQHWSFTKSCQQEVAEGRSSWEHRGLTPGLTSGILSFEQCLKAFITIK